MVKTLKKHGESLALVIDQPILELMGVDESTPLTVAFDGRSLIVTRANPEEHRKQVDQAIAEIHEEFGQSLARLAE